MKNLSRLSNLSASLEVEVLERITDAFFALDSNWNFTYVNRQAEKLLKLKRDKLLGKNIWEKFADAVDTAFYKKYQIVMHQRKAVTFEEYYKALNTWFKVKAYPDNGKGMFVFFTDISEWKNAQEKLKQAQQIVKESEERFRGVFLKAPHPIAITRLSDGLVLNINEAFLNQFEYKRAEVIGRTTKELDMWFDYTDRGQFIKELVKNKYVLFSDFIFRKKSKETFAGIMSATLVTDKNIPFVISEFIDVSKQRDIEHKLQQSTLRLREITENMADIITIHDQDHRYIYVSPGIKKVFNIEPERFINKTYWELNLPSKMCELFDSSIDQVFDTGKQMVVEYEHDKNTFYQSILTPEFNDHKQVISVLIVSRDISALKELDKRKNEFLSITSHELKTPVTSLKAYGQLVQKIFTNKGDLQAANLLSKMDTQVNKLTSLINDLLDVTKVESGKLQYRFDVFELDELIHNVVSELQMISEDHRIVIDGKTEALIYGDKDRLSQVFSNVLSNAIKYSPKNKSILVRSSKDKDKVHLEVSDQGVGIPKEKQEKIFERFYRVGGSQADTYPGLGLGLYISSEIIKRHQGDIWVESEMGKGSTFHIRLNHLA